MQTGFLRQPTNEVQMIQRAGELQSESRLAAAWHALRGRAVTAPAEAIDETVSFAEVVWAHHKRQQELEDDVLDGPWEQEYRRRLAVFKREHGEIVEAWWCRYEASATALTQKCRPRRFLPDDRIFRLHAATDWRTARAPRIASALHECETLAIRVSEILRDATEKVALHRLFAATSRLLAFVDKPGSGPVAAHKEMDRVLSANRAELRDIHGYYERAGENAARIVYFQGMALGAISLGVPLIVAALVGWYADGLGVIDLHEPRIQYLAVCITMGALGAIVSVMTRMASPGSFNTDFEVGRKPVRRLGYLRPFIGATFALALYIAVKSNLLELGNIAKPGIYFFATVSFLAGFSERRAKVLLGSVAGGAGTADAKK